MEKLFAFVALAFAFMLSPALADHHEGHGGPKMFEKADTDGDGAVSKEEFMKAQEEHFAKMDANGDGSFTKDEAEALKQKWAEKRKERMEKRAEKLPEEKTTPVAPSAQ